MNPCSSGKVGHKDRAAALAALSSIIKQSMLGTRRTDIHGECAAYSCRECGAWHLTSRPATNLIAGEV